MNDAQQSGYWSPWVSRAMDPDVVRGVTLPLKTPLSAVPRTHGGIELSHVAHLFLAYWMEVRGDKPLPDGSDIHPADFRAVAPYTRYMKWEGDRLVHRVWGSALTEALGADLTGTDLFDFVPAEDRDVAREGMRRLAEQPCGEVVIARSGDWAADKRLHEFLFLPVAPSPGGDGAGRMIGTCLLCDARELLDRIKGDGPVGEVELDRYAMIDVGHGVIDLEKIAEEMGR